ncbi:hypothetical protein [Colwellia sp. BRX9-1]|uniref:hypothetical protein n=1 Tax=Colwellia sp. BRX9-1 TaxID=2759830 RepID=UPI0015F58DAC|nr:hypothetical protein [Colwellia sp. BRX9-1]MBA6352715.1 hypothetical protein [Colwellia sp. BRX9-1]
MRVEFIEAFYMGIPLAIIIKYIHGWLDNAISPKTPYPTGQLIWVMATLAIILSIILAIVYIWLKYSHISLGLILAHTFPFFTYLFPGLCLFGIIFHVYDNNEYYSK